MLYLIGYLIGYFISVIVVNCSFIFLFTRINNGKYCAKNKYDNWVICWDKDKSRLTYNHCNIMPVLLFAFTWPISLFMFLFILLIDIIENFGNLFAKNNNDINK